MCYSNNLIESLRESVRKSLSRRQGLHFCVIPMEMNITVTYYTSPAPHQPFCCLCCWCRRRQHYLVKSKQYTRPLNVLLKIPQSGRPTHPLIQFLRHSHSPYCDSLCWDPIPVYGSYSDLRRCCCLWANRTTMVLMVFRRAFRGGVHERGRRNQVFVSFCVRLCYYYLFVMFLLTNWYI